MGICWPLCAKRRLQRRIVLILIGLDNAGKTQTVNSLSGIEESIMPTVGFKAVNLVHRDTPVTIYDLGGGQQIRGIWSQYYSEIHGVIFVIDSSDYQRMEECRGVLDEVISHERIAGKPILILANKQDKQGALDDIDVVEKLGIERLVNKYRCPTLVESYSAATPEYVEPTRKKRKLDPGLKKGYLWLLNYIIHHYGDINLRVQTDIHAELERRKRQSVQNSRLSETFIRDDVLETGFENPNYVTLSRDSTIGSEGDAKDLSNGVIAVQPVVRSSESGTAESIVQSDSRLENASTEPGTAETTATSGVENDITVENMDDEEPRLSPLFGRKNEDDAPKVIQLETRNTVSKLAPIRSKIASAVDRIPSRQDARFRPQSSPSVTVVKSVEAGVVEDSTFTEIDLARNGTLEREHAEVKSHEKTTPPAKPTSSDGALVARPRVADVRPASASQLVRRQLELAGTPRRRRFSLKYGFRNRTGPDQTGLFHYEPSGKETTCGERGDFQTAVQLSRFTHGDVTL